MIIIIITIMLYIILCKYLFQCNNWVSQAKTTVLDHLSGTVLAKTLYSYRKYSSFNGNYSFHFFRSSSMLLCSTWMLASSDSCSCFWFLSSPANLSCISSIFTAIFVTFSFRTCVASYIYVNPISIATNSIGRPTAY